MKILMIGCEYSGTTTMAIEISKWVIEVMGGPGVSFHDHWKVSEGGHIGKEGKKELDKDELEESINFTPDHRESYHHYLLSYHTLPAFFTDPHHLMTGMHIDDEIYGPKFKGYGEDQKKLDWMRLMSRYFEKIILSGGPDTVLLLLKASPDVIRKRMKESPHPHQLITERDVDAVLEKFQEHFDRSRVGRLGRKIVLDTSNGSVSETLAEFVCKIEPLLTDEDRLRILTHSMISA